MEKTIRRELLPGVHITIVRTRKFKTARLSVTLLRRMSRQEASLNALLPKVLRRGTADHPDMQSLSAALDELYGASIEPFVAKKGEVQSFGFAATFLDDVYTGGEDLLEQVAELTGQLLTDPATRGGRFLPQYVESERDTLCREIRSLVDDKPGYSLMRLRQFMCPGEGYGLDRLGTLSAAEAITGSRLYHHYTEVLATSQIELFYCGSADPLHVEQVLRRALTGLPNGQRLAVRSEIGRAPEKVSFKSERLDVAQCNLALGFRTGITAADEEYPALVVFNALLGGTTSSRLFLNVRERLSLCYYASSGLDAHKGVLLVLSGVQRDKFEAARDEILRQLAQLQAGEITPEELTAAKSSVIDSYRGIGDSKARMDDYCLNCTIADTPADPALQIRRIEQVTAEQAAHVGARVALDTIYLLEGEEQ